MIAEMPKLTPKSSSKKKKPEAMALTDPAGVVEDLPLKMEAPVTLDESKFVRFPNSPYQLYQPFPPAGDQPAAIDQLCEGLFLLILLKLISLPISSFNSKILFLTSSQISCSRFFLF